MDSRIVYTDRVIGMDTNFIFVLLIEWLSSLYRQQWERMLLAFQGVDVGPKEEMSEERFNLLAFRCGRILEGDMQVSGVFVSEFPPPPPPLVSGAFNITFQTSPTQNSSGIPVFKAPESYSNSLNFYAYRLPNLEGVFSKVAKWR